MGIWAIFMLFERTILRFIWLLKLINLCNPIIVLIMGIRAIFMVFEYFEAGISFADIYLWTILKI